MNFVDRILNLLSQQGITKNKMLTDLHLSKNSIIDWQKRGTIPNGETLSKIANYFNVSVDYLLGNAQKEKPVAKSDEPDITFDDFTYAFLDESKELTEENKAKLLEMAKFFKQQQDKEKGNIK